MNTLDPELEAADDIVAVYLIVNEEWGMSPGKIASQAFQACQRLLTHAESADTERQTLLADWERGFTRTITKFAPTRHLFDRCCTELAGITMIDEGLTEGTCGPTIHATWPLRRGDLPRLLRHKQIRLLPRRPGG